MMRFFGDLRGFFITDFRRERRDEHERVLHVLRDAFAIRFQTFRAMNCERMQRLSQQTHGFEIRVDEYRFVHVQLKLTVRCGHRDCGAVAVNAAGHHRERFALRRIHFARHDGRTRFIFRNRDFRQSGARSACQQTHIVGDFKRVHRERFQGAVAVHELVVSGQRVKFIGGRNEIIAGRARDFFRHAFREPLRRIEARADGGAAQREGVEMRFAFLDHFFRSFQHRRPTGNFLAQCQGRRVLQMRAADFDDVHEVRALLL